MRCKNTQRGRNRKKRGKRDAGKKRKERAGVIGGELINAGGEKAVEGDGENVQAVQNRKRRGMADLEASRQR